MIPLQLLPMPFLPFQGAKKCLYLLSPLVSFRCLKYSNEVFSAQSTKNILVKVTSDLPGAKFHIQFPATFYVFAYFFLFKISSHVVVPGFPLTS